MINLCDWGSANFLIFSKNVFDPLIYYTHFFSLIIASVVGLGIFLINKKTLANKLLILINLFFCIWVFFDLILWADSSIEHIMFFWSIMIFFDLLIYLTALYFVYVFINERNMPFIKTIVVGLFFLPLILFVATRYNLEFFNLLNCDREAREGILWRGIYFMEAIISIWIVIEGFIGFRKQKNRKKEIIIVMVGIILFLFMFAWGNIVGTITDDWAIAQYGLLGMPIMMIFLGYASIKFDIFNIKLFASQTLIAGQVILIGSMFFFVRTAQNQILTGITLILTGIMGWNLIKSTKKEAALREELEVSNLALAERKEQLQKMADGLAKSNDRLRVLDNAKTEFISIASHQLRTPLTAIKGFISMLNEGVYGKLSPRHVEVLDKVYASNERLVLLVEDLLNVSRIESGRMEFKFAECEVEKICEELVDGLKSRAEEHNLYLEYSEPKTSLPKLMIDGAKIREVISNLVDNALKYTLDGHGGVRVKTEQIEDCVRITVSDTGIGIPQEEMKFLFEKFSRGKDISRLNTSGTGLGLYICRGIVENNGGKIWIESAGANMGSRFIVELPIHQSQELMDRVGVIRDSAK